MEIKIDVDSEGWFTLDIDGELENGLCKEDVIGEIETNLKDLEECSKEKKK